MSRFTGFPPETFEFLNELSQHNRRSWFEANRERYERDWKDPALAFIAALGPGMAAMEPAMKAEAKLNASLRRINRDTRFSADKAPYEPWLHLIFWPGERANKGAGFHFVLRGDGIGYGAGRYAFDGPSLGRYREKVQDPKARQQLLDAIEEEVAEARHRVVRPKGAHVKVGAKARFVARLHRHGVDREVVALKLGQRHERALQGVDDRLG